jgi:hypothetical protein
MGHVILELRHLVEKNPIILNVHAKAKLWHVQ